MARNTLSTSLLIGFGALGIGLIAIFLQPTQEALVSILNYQGLNSPIDVFDPELEVRYVGKRAASGVEHFQNIFYAEDTSGPNRFAPPVPVRPVKGSVVDASLPGAWCPQGLGDVLPFTSQVTNVSENCLSLRIARPGGTHADAKLPVMVWLHGGE